MRSFIRLDYLIQYLKNPTRVTCKAKRQDICLVQKIRSPSMRETSMQCLSKAEGLRSPWRNTGTRWRSKVEESRLWCPWATATEECLYSKPKPNKQLSFLGVEWRGFRDDVTRVHVQGRSSPFISVAQKPAFTRATQTYSQVYQFSKNAIKLIPRTEYSR
jgi:hypothetical protein